MTATDQDRLEAPTAVLTAAGIDADMHRFQLQSLAELGYTSHELCGFARGLVKAARRRGEIA